MGEPRERTATHCYIARKPCGHVVYVAVDDGDKSIGKDLGVMIADGRTIERMELEEFRSKAAELMTCECPVTPEEEAIKKRHERRRSRDGKRGRR